jgi:hypothetical protein
MVGALLLYYLAGREDLDEALCRRGQPPASHVAVLLDPTDPFSADEMQTVQRLISHVVSTLPIGGRLSVLALLSQSGQEVAQVLFSRCLPHDGTNGSRATRNLRLDSKVYREAFERPLTQAVGKVGAVQEAAKASPIVATLHQISFMPAFMSSPHRQLLMVSDALEHSKHTLSHYRKQYSFEKLKGSVYVQEDMFSGVDVRLIQRTNGAARPHQEQPRHEQFWRDYFMYTGATFHKEWF